MGSYNIQGIGTANVEKKTFSCDFSVSSAEFFAKFPEQIAELPSSLVDDIRKAIDSGKDIKFDKKYRDDLENFFYQIQNAPQASSMGFGSDEKEEEEEAESYKELDTDSETIQYNDASSDDGIQTVDSETGKVEGTITLGEEGNTGELIELNVVETLDVGYEFNGEEPKEDAKNISGKFVIKNPSSRNKIWDVDITFTKDKEVSLEDTISLKTLEPDEEKEYEYEIQDFENPAIAITEFISTLNDPETETYSLSTTDQNVVYGKITVKNTVDYPVHDVVVKKEILSGYTDVNVIETSLGDATIDGNDIVWKIEELEPEAEVYMSYNMSIEVAGADVKARTGKVSAEYQANRTISGTEVDKFDAYSDNFVGIQQVQADEDPDLYYSSVIFKNKSDFQLKIVNLDIVNADTGEKVLDIDPNDIPPLAAGAMWESVEWETKTEDGMEPQFYKTVEFFVLSNRTHSTLGTISIDDIELAVALMIGRVQYSVSSIPSFRVVSFDVVHDVKNIGGADLNDVIFEETIQSGFIPPKPEEIELYVIRPEPDEEVSSDFEELDWNDLGELIDIDDSLIEITPNDQDPDKEHVVRINLSDLKENAIGMFLPGMVFRVKYPIQAYKVPKDTEYVANIKYIGNTYPAGSPIEVIPEGVTIPVVHERKKVAKGKTVRALPEPGEYEIILSVQNVGVSPIKDVQIRDIVPHNFEYTDLSIDPTDTDSLEGKDMLIWKIEEIQPDEEIEIRYKLKGIGDDYRASESQLSA